MKKEKETIQKIKTIEFEDLTLKYNSTKINKLEILKYNTVFSGLIIVSILLSVLSMFALKDIAYPWTLVLVGLITGTVCVILSLNILNLMTKDKKAINLVGAFLKAKTVTVLFNNKGNASLIINNTGRVISLKYLIKDTGIAYKIVNTAKVNDKITIDIDATSNEIILVNIVAKEVDNHETDREDKK